MARPKVDTEALARVEPPTTTTLAAPSYIEDSKDGYENVRARDIEFPRLKLVQRMSQEAGDGAAAGDVLNHLTGKVVASGGKPFNFIPVIHFVQWIEWNPIDSGGGIKEMSVDPKSALAARAERSEKDKQGKFTVTEYHNFLVVLPDEAEADKVAMLSCHRTNFKHGRRLISLARMRRGKALYAGLYSCRTVPKEKPPYKWYEFAFENNGWATEADFATAKSLYQEYAAKVAQFKPPVEDADSVEVVEAEAATDTTSGDSEY